MFWQRTLYQHPEFKLGLRDLAPQAFGQVAWALMTGVALVKSGMSVFESVAMTLLVYAGSSQLAATPLIVAGAPAWVVLATGFCVNLRFVVFSLHMRGYLMHLPRLPRIITGYFTTDISYVLFTRRFAHPAQTDEQRVTQEAYLAGLSFANWSSWMAFSLLGIALANAIPMSWGLGFAGILCLLGIQCSLASSRLRVLSSLVAGVVAVLAYALPLKLNIVLAIVMAVLACLMIEQLKALKEKPV
ncbi:AzlC family ABC transporter permease [Limnohabitans sp.]|uniref:AzlC family ABC transporter permease n=1 Tax=Limnohabitans sp. TaxID=1907725 RepID=UPI00286F847D|nr:AzlC family ABC transporter permease [Limnohabitans sp.]